MSKTVFGIDYGSKLTGNTVIAIFLEDQIIFMDVDKGVDADQFILNAADHFKPTHIFIDAPLSLPGVYANSEEFENYHFRKADLELKAMSPMFLGGLAARAMELKAKLEARSIEVMETYPKILALRFKLKARGYKGSRINLKDCKRSVLRRFGSNIEIDSEDITTWHHLDALLALISAVNHTHGKSEVFGDHQEGLIYI
ncbi:MAG: DUF429 domain-containing protein [Owenweeksia sp.]